MKRTNQIWWIISFFVLFYLGYEPSLFAIENYTLKPLFELKTGRGVAEFLLAFAPAPFAPEEGRKIPFSYTGAQVLVDNSGNFLLLNERINIVKINSKGEVIGEIRGVKPFTVPMRMRLDGEDNLYVMFSNDTNIAELFRYRVAKFNKQGQLLHWIGDEKGFKCIFLGVNVNGTVSITSCAFEDHIKYRDQFQRYDKEGRFIGSFTHRGITVKDTVDAINGRHGISIGHILAVGMNGNAYVVNDFDFTIKKYDDYVNLTTTEGVKPVAERAVFPWQVGKYAFQGFDVNNKMYFYHSPDGRIRKRVELSKDYYVDVLDFSRPLKLECFRYDFEKDKYDSLVCEAVIKEEGKFATQWDLRNYIGELYELVIFYNDPPNVTPEDHVRFYKWERVK
jgi:hypothetical protein